MRFKEYYLAPGDHAFVMGTAGDNPFIGETQAKSETEACDLAMREHPGHIVRKSQRFHRLSLGGRILAFVMSASFLAFGGFGIDDTLQGRNKGLIGNDIPAIICIRPFRK